MEATIVPNQSLLEKVRDELESVEHSGTIAGLDFLCEMSDSSKKNNKIRCAICNCFVSRNGVCRHLKSDSHQSNYMEHCFSSTFTFLLGIIRQAKIDGEMCKISKALIQALIRAICDEIGLKYYDTFIPWSTNNMSQHDFHSNALIQQVLSKTHVNEEQNPETRSLINQTFYNFMKKTEQLLALIGFGNRGNKEEASVVKKRKLNSNDAMPSLSTEMSDAAKRKETATEPLTSSEMERMKTAIIIAMELKLRKGVEISPAELEESVKLYYKHNLKKTMTNDDLETMEALTKDDIKCLVENYESLTEIEQEKLKSYLTMLRKIDDKVLLELNSDEKFVNMLKEIL